MKIVKNSDWRIGNAFCQVTSAMAFFLFASTAPFAAERRNAGTLTCTVESSSKPSVPVECRYRPASGGAEMKFTGKIAQLGADQRLKANRVLVWMVLGTPLLDASDLESTFVRRNPPSTDLTKGAKEGLIGGVDDAIALVPPSGREQIPGNAALTVLKLSLTALKV